MSVLFPLRLNVPVQCIIAFRVQVCTQKSNHDVNVWLVWKSERRTKYLEVHIVLV